MHDHTRRGVAFGIGSAAAAQIFSARFSLSGTRASDYGGDQLKRQAEIEQWMTQWLKPQTRAEALPLSRFKDPIYFLLQSISWKPNSEQGEQFTPVEVPTGFVTDLASMPRFFWSALRPDGVYAYAAIIHDYLYWVQSRPREIADSIFLMAMEDSHITPKTRLLIYESVRDFGDSVWSDNARLKAQGEKRILAIFPDDPTTISWDAWKKRPGVFA